MILQKQNGVLKPISVTNLIHEQQNNLSDLLNGTTTNFYDNKTLSFSVSMSSLLANATTIRLKAATSVSSSASTSNNLKKVLCDNATTIGSNSFRGANTERMYFPKATSMHSNNFNSTKLEFVYAPLYAGEAPVSSGTTNDVMEYFILPKNSGNFNSGALLAGFSALKEIYLGNTNVATAYCVNNAYYLKALCLDGTAYYGLNSTIQNCYNLLDLYLLNNSYKVELRNTSCFTNTVARSYYDETYYTGPVGAKMKIHVPANLLSSYQNDTRWSELDNVEFVSMTDAEIEAKRQYYLDIQESWRVKMLEDFPNN